MSVARHLPVLALLFSILTSGCQSPYHSDQGALFGGLLGAGTGAAVGSAVGKTGAGAAIGAGVGGAAGTGAVMMTKGDPAVLPSESLVTVTLKSPISVTAAAK